MSMFLLHFIEAVLWTNVPQNTQSRIWQLCRNEGNRLPWPSYLLRISVVFSQSPKNRRDRRGSVVFALFQKILIYFVWYHQIGPHGVSRARESELLFFNNESNDMPQTASWHNHFVTSWIKIRPMRSRILLLILNAMTVEWIHEEQTEIQQHVS